MDNKFIFIIVFIIVLFFYLHIYFQHKKSNDLEIFELDSISKEKFEEIINLKQPFLFNYKNELQEICKKRNLVNKYGVFDVKVRNIKDKLKDEEELYIPFNLENIVKIIDNDNNKYLTENNMDFIEETNLKKKFRYNDVFLRPYFVQSSIYDICIGSNGVVTPLQYYLNCRNFIIVNEGSINIKLFPPKYSKYLHCVKDFENFEFKSEINPWNVNDKFKNDFDKVKCLNLELKENKILSIPPFWWYSIKYNNDTSICIYQYKTFMNNISILPELIINFLQMKNIKKYNFSRVKNIIFKNDNINNKNDDINNDINNDKNDDKNNDKNDDKNNDINDDKNDDINDNKNE